MQTTDWYRGFFIKSGAKGAHETRYKLLDRVQANFSDIRTNLSKA